jgi:putative ABC transport system substrate-binding protein
MNFGFSILDFGLRRKHANEKSSLRILNFCSDSLKSKTENLKWAGFFAIVVALTVCGAPVQAQQPKKVPRIGFLSALSRAPMLPNLEQFWRRLRELGWIEGQNIAIEYRWAEGKYERLPDLAAELVRLKVDVIFANSGPAALAAKRATGTVPVVFEILGDPVSAGLVDSLARPGGNLTGVSGLAPELSGKQIELLKEVVPRLTRIAVLANPFNKVALGTLRETQTAAKSLGVRIQVLEVSEPDKLEGAFSAIAADPVNGLIVLTDPMFTGQRQRILGLVEKSRLPAVYFETGWVPAGGLMSYSSSLPDQFRKAAGFIDKILKGAKPSDLPVEQPTQFELIINLKTAKRIGLTIPPNVLARANKVIK